MKMEECNKFDKCSAPICPLDPDYKLRVHLSEDRVCLYLREYAKKPTQAELKVSVPEDMYKLLASVSDDILSRGKGDKFGTLKTRLIIAEKGKSKMFGSHIGNLK